MFRYSCFSFLFVFSFILFGVLLASWIYSLVSDINLGEILSYYYLKYCFHSYYSSFFGYSHYVYVIPFIVVL